MPSPKRRPQCRQEVFGTLDPVALRAKTLGELDEVGIGEFNAGGTAEMAVLMPFDQPVFAVGENQDDQVEAKPERRSRSPGCSS